MSKKLYEYHTEDEPHAPIHGYYECLAIAWGLGFNSWSHAVRDTYMAEGTIDKTSKVLKVSTTKVRESLMKQGISRKKIPKIRRYNYHPQDEQYAPIHFYGDALRMAKNLGYDSYSEAVRSVYIKCKSQRITANIFAVSPGAIRLMLKKMGEPINGPGGNNRRTINMEGLRCNEK